MNCAHLENWDNFSKLIALLSRLCICICQFVIMKNIKVTNMKKKKNTAGKSATRPSPPICWDKPLILFNEDENTGDDY